MPTPNDNTNDNTGVTPAMVMFLVILVLSVITTFLMYTHRME